MLGSLLIASGLLATSGQLSGVTLGEGSPPTATNLQAEFVCGENKVQARFETSLGAGGKATQLLWNNRPYPAAVLQSLNLEFAAMQRISSVSARCDKDAVRVLVGGLATATPPGSDDLVVEFAVNEAGISAKPMSLR